MAVVEDLVTGNDGLSRSAVIRTKNGVTNRPITKLYPLELTEGRDAEVNNSDQPPTTEMRQDSDSPTVGRPRRNAAQQARLKVAKWIDDLQGPPEDVGDSD